MTSKSWRKRNRKTTTIASQTVRIQAKTAQCCNFTSLANKKSFLSSLISLAYCLFWLFVVYNVRFAWFCARWMPTEPIYIFVCSTVCVCYRAISTRLLLNRKTKMCNANTWTTFCFVCTVAFCGKKHKMVHLCSSSSQIAKFNQWIVSLFCCCCLVWFKTHLHIHPTHIHRHTNSHFSKY